MKRTRRTVLALTGGTLAGLAGCLGDDDDSENGGQNNSSDGPSENGGQNESENGSENGEENGSENGGDDQPENPVEAGELLVEAMAAGEFQSAFELFSESVRSGNNAASRALSVGQLEALWLGFTAVGGSFESVVDGEATTVSTFDAADLTLGFERGEHVLRVLTGENLDIVGANTNDEYQRPDYVDTATFETRETQLETDDCIMDAAVTVPTGAQGDVPGVVLVHGSDPTGQADLDLTAGGSKPFQDIAEGLATNGVAVYRFDRRSNACRDSVPNAEYTLDAASVDDALTAIDQLRGVDGVDSDRVAVAGLSLGAMVVPRIARRDDNLVGGIAMAAPARPFHEIFLDQYEYLATVGDHEWTQMETLFSRWSDRIDRIREGDYQPGDIVLGYPGALWDSASAYDQIETARTVDTPLFFLQGQRDYQVTVEDDFATWRAELADRPATRFQSYEGLNHLFQYGEGPSVPTEYALNNPVDSAVVTDMADWVREQ